MVLPPPDNGSKKKAHSLRLLFASRRALGYGRGVKVGTGVFGPATTISTLTNSPNGSPLLLNRRHTPLYVPGRKGAVSRTVALTVPPGGTTAGSGRVTPPSTSPLTQPMVYPLFPGAATGVLERPGLLKDLTRRQQCAIGDGDILQETGVIANVSTTEVGGMGVGVGVSVGVGVTVTVGVRVGGRVWVGSGVAVSRAARVCSTRRLKFRRQFHSRAHAHRAAARQTRRRERQKQEEKEKPSGHSNLQAKSKAHSNTHPPCLLYNSADRKDDFIIWRQVCRFGIIVGAQWGDEGKGRIVDWFAAQADVVARYNGGDNAGHSVTVGEQLFKLHLIPSGIIHERPVAVLGNGMVINPESLLKEMEMLAALGVEISPPAARFARRAFDYPRPPRAGCRPGAAARQRQPRPTGRGIGPTYTDKAARTNLRVGDLLSADFGDKLAAHLEAANRVLASLNAPPLDIPPFRTNLRITQRAWPPHRRYTPPKRALCWRAAAMCWPKARKGTLLDLDHAHLPFVTSSATTAEGVFTGLGIGVTAARDAAVTGVCKSFQTRVGSGPLPHRTLR